MAGNARRLGLHGLRPSYLQSFRCGEGVERHVLRLERSRVVTILLEDAAEGGGDNALAHVAACADEHDGMQLIFFHISRRSSYRFVS